MNIIDRNKRKKAAIEKELAALQKQENRLARAAGQSDNAVLSGRIKEKIPEKVNDSLESAFCKAFSLIFEKGTGIIEKSFDKDGIQEEYDVQNYAIHVRGNRKELRRMRNRAKRSEIGNVAASAVEGIGLGALGIGLPDIVLFTGVLLKGIYETALHYGFSYDIPGEQALILKMMQTAVSRGEEWEKCNGQVDEFIGQKVIPDCTDAELKVQIEQTAAAYAADMLVLKFIQGLPLVGMIGGAGNPVYYHKVMQYVEVKYRKRYLKKLYVDACKK